jgi:hypothetical protein
LIAAGGRGADLVAHLLDASFGGCCKITLSQPFHRFVCLNDWTPLASDKFYARDYLQLSRLQTAGSS